MGDPEIGGEEEKFADNKPNSIEIEQIEINAKEKEEDKRSKSVFQRSNDETKEDVRLYVRVCLRRPHFSVPAFNSVICTANGDVQTRIRHSLGVVQPSVTAHASRIGTFLREKHQHGKQEVRKLSAPRRRILVFLAKNIGQCPMT